MTASRSVHTAPILPLACNIIIAMMMMMMLMRFSESPNLSIHVFQVSYKIGLLLIDQRKTVCLRLTSIRVKVHVSHLKGRTKGWLQAILSYFWWYPSNSKCNIKHPKGCLKPLFKWVGMRFSANPRFAPDMWCVLWSKAPTCILAKGPWHYIGLRCIRSRHRRPADD